MIGFALLPPRIFDPPIMALAWAVAGRVLQMPISSRTCKSACWCCRGLFPQQRVWRVMRTDGASDPRVSVSQISLIISTILPSFWVSGLGLLDVLRRPSDGTARPVCSEVALGTILPSLASFVKGDATEYRKAGGLGITSLFPAGSAVCGWRSPFWRKQTVQPVPVPKLHCL